MHAAVVTLFPEMVEAGCRYGICGRALTAGLLRLTTVSPRDHAPDRHRTVDDRPYGGGPGMVMMVGPARAAIREAREAVGNSAPVLFMSPQGRAVDQQLIGELAAGPSMILLCGRYEGVDERLVELEVDAEISLGDFVLSGGEVPALAVIDAVTRVLPGALGHDESAARDSFADGLLDHPHYTRPEDVDGLQVPSVLQSGHHAEIERWRLKQALGRTAERRPELLRRRGLSDLEQALLDEYRAERHNSQSRRT